MKWAKEDVSRPGTPKSSVDTLHQREKDELFKLLKQAGENLPEGGERLLDIFLQTEGHVSPKYFLDQLHSYGVKLDPEKVADILELLCRYGIAQKVLLNGSGPYFEHLHLGGDHDHFLCTHCGMIAEFKDRHLTQYLDGIAKDHDFLPLHQKIAVLGLCSNCRKRAVASVPLSMAACGEKVRIVNVSGGRRFQNRLTSMGLHVGDTVEILNNTGPIIINAKGTRLALGMGLAKKILVVQAK